MILNECPAPDVSSTNNHATNREASDHASARGDLVFATRRYQDHATRCCMRCIVFPVARCAYPEASVSCEERCREAGNGLPRREKTRLQLRYKVLEL